MARFIDDHPTLKPVVRIALVPPLAMATVAVKTTLAQKVAIVGSIALFVVVCTLLVARRRRAVKRE